MKKLVLTLMLAASAPSFAMVNLGDNVLNTVSEVDAKVNAKAPLANPTFTGTVKGVTQSMVGLGNVDNTSDANKPVSAATQAAISAAVSNLDAGFVQLTPDSYNDDLYWEIGSMGTNQSFVAELIFMRSFTGAGSFPYVAEYDIIFSANLNGAVRSASVTMLPGGYNPPAIADVSIVKDETNSRWLLKVAASDSSTMKRLFINVKKSRQAMTNFDAVVPGTSLTHITTMQKYATETI